MKNPLSIYVKWLETVGMGFLILLMIPHAAGTAAVRDKDRRVANVRGYTFEDRVVPSTWVSIPSGALSVSTKHFKHGRRSLRWTWTGGARVTVDNLKSTSSVDKVGAVRAWIYNENPLDAALRFRFGTKPGLERDRPQYSFEFGLMYKGWRAFWVDLSSDAERGAGAGKGAVSTMDITAPRNGSGNLFFDIIEFEDRMGSKRSADFQVPFVNVGSESHWQQAYRWSRKQPVDPLPARITRAERQAFATIADRYVAWFMGVDVYPTDPFMKWRYDALQSFIAKGVKTYSKLAIKRDGDTITGVPLFASISPYGPKFSRHTIAETMIPLVLDYKANGNESSKDKLLDLFDYLHDQGWAEGSANGSMDHELNRSSAYLQAVFLMKDELEAAGILDRERRTMGWYTEIGEIYEPPALPGTTADRVITHLPYRLLSVLTMKDGPEKVRAMRNVVRWIDNSFAITPGWAGLIKPDYLAFHHKAHYGGAYGTPALQSAAFLYYLLHGTPFSLSETSHNNIKQGLLFIRAYSNKYDIPVGVSGRMPFTEYMLLKYIPAYAYLALSGDPVDEEMAAAFKRLWDPESELTKRFYIRRLTDRDAYVHTLGDLQLVQKTAALGINPEPAPEGHWAKNYGAFSVHRRDNWMVSVRGHSKYVWDYEGHHREPDSQNIFGRYQGHGALQIFGSGDPVGDDASGYVEDGWDWQRWPNTTVIRLPLDELDIDKARNFTDRPFVGGVEHNSGNGVFVMDYHDTTFDKSFYARKSVFFFDDTIVCLGSGIRNSDSAHPTETTLFQNYLHDKRPPVYVNSTEPVAELPYEKRFETNEPICVMDAYGNGYYIAGGQKTSIHRKVQKSLDDAGKRQTEGEYAAAWLDHGTAPGDASYEFAIRIKSTPDNMAAFARHPIYKVLRKDNRAHIVRCDTLNMTGYALFEKDMEFKRGPVRSTDAPCLVMVRRTDSVIDLSICDPDLRLMKDPVPDMSYIKFNDLYSESVPANLRLELNGTWRLTSQNENVRVLLSPDGRTTLQIRCKDGLTTNLTLAKQPA